MSYLAKVNHQLRSEGISSEWRGHRLVFQAPKPDIRIYLDVVRYDHERVIEISAEQETEAGVFGLGVLGEYDADTRLGEAVNAVRFFTGH